MTLIHTVLFAIVQSLTEFLPISSSGHLIALPALLGLGPNPLVFDVVLHLGTATSLVLYFRKDLLAIARGFLADIVSKKSFAHYSANAKLAVYILLASLPAGVMGLLLEDAISYKYRHYSAVAFLLIIGSLLMVVAELALRARKKKSEVAVDVSLDKALVIGFFQGLALFPGISRSGATISGGLLIGLSREKAARFSFLLSIPIVLAAGSYEVLKLAVAFPTTGSEISGMYLAVGYVVSFLVGILAIDVLLRFLKTHSLFPFIVYRLIFAAFLLWVF